VTGFFEEQHPEVGPVGKRQPRVGRAVHHLGDRGGGCARRLRKKHPCLRRGHDRVWDARGLAGGGPDRRRGSWRAWGRTVAGTAASMSWSGRPLPRSPGPGTPRGPNTAGKPGDGP